MNKKIFTEFDTETQKSISTADKRQRERPPKKSEGVGELNLVDEFDSSVMPPAGQEQLSLTDILVRFQIKESKAQANNLSYRSRGDTREKFSSFFSVSRPNIYEEYQSTEKVVQIKIMEIVF